MTTTTTDGKDPSFNRVEREIYELHDVNALLLQSDQKSLAKEAA